MQAPNPFHDQGDTWYTFEQQGDPALIYRKGEDEFHIFLPAPPSTEPAEPHFKVTSEPRPNNEQPSPAWHVNGQFVWMENPWWLNDLCEEMSIGGYLYLEGW